MTIRVHYYERRDGVDVCKNCGVVRNRDAVGPRWCPGKPPAIETRSECVVPPPGWRCTRAAGHDGPCAAERESEAAKITRAEIEELRRRVAEAQERERAGIVGSITVRLRLAERLLDAADERDRLRELLAECADVLPSLEHFGRYTSSERDARELRARIEAELRQGDPAPNREADKQQQRERNERLGPAVDRSDER